MVLPRPSEAMLRGNCLAQLKRNIGVSLVSSVFACAAFYFAYMRPKWAKYDAFERTYDPYVTMEEICKKNYRLLVTCPENLAEKLREKGAIIPEEAMSKNKPQQY